MITMADDDVDDDDADDDRDCGEERAHLKHKRQHVNLRLCRCIIASHEFMKYNNNEEDVSRDISAHGDGDG